MTDTAAPADGGQGAAAPSSSAVLTAAPAAPAAAPTSQQIAPAPAPQPATAAIPWLEGADEVTLGYAANKGWQKPADLLSSYQNLEKLMGADRAGNTVVIPKDGADPKEWQAVYDRLGRPSDVKGYNVPVPEGGDPKLQEEMLKVAHELGLSKVQVEGLFGKFNGTAVQAIQAQQQAKAAAFQADDAAVKSEWGAAYTQNLAIAQTAARGLGLDSATIDKLSDSLGHKGTMELLHKIGTKLGEPDFVAGDKTEQFGAVMSPGQAKAEIQALMADRNFAKLYMAKDSKSMARMQQLHQWAYPE